MTAISTRLGIDVEGGTPSSSITTPSFRRPDSNLQPHPPQHPSDDGAVAPVFVIRDLATEMGVESPGATRSAQSAPTAHGPDLIDEGLMSIQEAFAMFKMSASPSFIDAFLVSMRADMSMTRFHEHYGRWVSFDGLSSSEALFKNVRRSPLLLSSCCLIAVRHTSQDKASRLAPELFDRSKSLLSTALLSSPQTVEFFQAALVLSMWSTTVGQVPLSIDSWLVSGFAIQHCLSSDLFAPVLDERSSPSTKRELELLGLWNHLCLVHLQYVLEGRLLQDDKNTDPCSP